MIPTYNKAQILRQLAEVTAGLSRYVLTIDDVSFFDQPADKWSIAQHIDHLTISAKATRPAFSLPKLLIRYYAGKPNRPSRSYDELVTRYQQKLANGGHATGKFIPAPVSRERKKELIASTFVAAMDHLALPLDRKWKEDQLDQYLAPHPLLGKITTRELCYFTIYHVIHHHRIIRERLNG